MSIIHGGEFIFLHFLAKKSFLFCPFSRLCIYLIKIRINAFSPKKVISFLPIFPFYYYFYCNILNVFR